uniref:MFS domain-containing protein n=1 Tax=Steinernema glaseri TaxID=37863 RepID=A0A1I7YKY1_9BILA
MTCMVNSTAVVLQSTTNTSYLKELVHAESCPRANNDNGNSFVNDYGGTLVWSSGVQALLFSGTFWGALVTVMPAGYFADRSSPVLLLQVAAALYIICTAVLPYLALHWGYLYVFVSRVIMGLGEGVLIPSINTLVTRWFPTDERSTAAALYTAGNQIAAAFGNPVAAALCASPLEWPAVFYLCATIGTLWLIIWRFTVRNSPSKSHWISQRERIYLEKCIPKAKPHSKKDHTIPWRAMATSLPLWALFVCQYAANTIVVFMQIYLPSFFKEVLFLPMVDNGLYSAAPSIVQLFVKVFWGMLMDKLKKKKYLSVTATCKLSQAVSCLTTSVVFILIANYASCNTPLIALSLVCIIAGGFGIAISGFYMSLLCLAPAHTGTISALSMVIGILGRLTTPEVVAYFKVYGTLDEWKNILYFFSFLLFSSGLIFCIFGSGEHQEWGVIKPTATEEKELSKLEGLDEESDELENCVYPDVVST